ncbi:MAG: CBS domain-containing protein [Nitrososphaerota archaeon]|nr:CBS domain-containing protein [Nitrososphaerota archaeon]
MRIAEEVRVRDVMSSPVIESKEDETAQEIAQKMMRYRIGAIVVTDEKGSPLGIVTKTDLVEKVIARNLRPDEVKAREIMNTPLETIDPEAKLEDALRKMNKLKISRLAVVYKNKLAGLISLKDILQVTPEILEIVREHMKIMGITLPRNPEGYVEGYCDSCGEWSDMLLNIEGQYLCEDCRLDLIRRGKQGEE